MEIGMHFGLVEKLLLVVTLSVIASELMGNETLVFVAAGQRLIAIAPAEFRAAVDSILPLRISVEKAHFFDPKTEERM